MARIRTVKPEFYKHEDLSDLPPETHLLAGALINYADDEGYFNANPKRVKSECCPLREDSVSVHDMLMELSKIGYLRLCEGTDGKNYGQIVTFAEHQRVNRPTPSKIKGLLKPNEPSSTTHAQFSEPSLPEGKGMEGKGREGGAAAQRGEFAFVGKLVRLNFDDYENWRRRFHAIPDFNTELAAADEYYVQNPPKDGKWFFQVSNWLKKAHGDALERERGRNKSRAPAI